MTIVELMTVAKDKKPESVFFRIPKKGVGGVIKAIDSGAGVKDVKAMLEEKSESKGHPTADIAGWKITEGW